MESNEKNNLTGFASIDKPWMKFYPPALIENLTIPEVTVEEYLRGAAATQTGAPLLYYGNYITWDHIFAEAEQSAKALRVLGFGEGDQIPVFLRSVPEFQTLLLGAEMIGASILSRDNTLEENIEAVQQSGSKIIFAMDFLSHADMNEFRAQAHVHTTILLSPYRSAVYKEIPDYIHESIDALYPKNPAHGPRTLDWDAFLALGNEWEGEFRAKKDVRRPLLRAYTSGSTGPSKQVIHSANTIIGNFHQLSFYKIPSDKRTAFFQSPLPPALVAVVVAMTLFPMASGQRLIINPWVDPKDIDLELMRMKPECWSAIPMFVELVFHEGRIPADMDMSWLKQVGVGCEPFNNRQFARAQAFLNAHNSPAVLTSGYGSSEAGSALTLPSMTCSQGNGNVGIPMPLTTISIFEPGTKKEVEGYGKMGEICVSGPGNMVGYNDVKSTARALQKHEDGQTWLHTGDIGYMNEDGVIFALTRGSAPRYGFKNSQLATLPMENVLADANIRGIDDEFFVIIPDPDHRHCFLPILYVVLERGYGVEDVRDDINDALEEYMRPVDIIQLSSRPFYHFKTNRIGLTKKLREYNFEN